MAFKLRSGKTPTIYMQGTAPNKLAKEKAVAKMKQAAAAKKKMEDGRAGSSAFQQKGAEEGKKLRTYLAKVEAFLDKGFSQKEAEQMVKSGADLPNQKKEKKEDKNKDVVASKDKKPSPNKQKVSQEDFEPAYPGADYSKEQIAKMTRKEKEQKIDGYDPKLDGVKKGKIVYKDGKKFYQASDGSLHTGQVEDYERELKVDKEMKKGKKPSPNKQAKPDFLDLDGDGDKTESMKKAAADKKGSPSKQKYDAAGSDERVYDINQEKYDAWAAKTPGAPDIRYLGSKKNNKFLEAYLKSKKKSTGDKGKKSTKFDELKKANPMPKPKQPMKMKEAPAKQTKKQREKLPANLVKEIAKAQGNASPAKQKSKLLPSENPDTYVYDGNVHREKVNDLEDRISFIREDMFNETGDSVQQKKDIATLQKQLKKLKANKPKASAPNKMKSPAKQVMEQTRKAPKYKRKPIPAPTGRTGYLVMEEPKNREFEPIVAGRRRPTKTKVGKFLSKITKRKKKK